MSDSQPTGATDDTDGLELLVKRSASGDEQAFAQLYDATASRVYGLVLRVIGDQALAEEVTQEAYVHIWQHADRFDPGRGRALSWLTMIAHRRAVDRVRSVETARRHEAAYRREQPPPAPDPTAEHAAASLEVQHVRTALTTLTPVQRDVIELAFFGGHTHTEVASILGVPLGTAKTRIRQGLLRLRDAMEVYAGD